MNFDYKLLSALAAVYELQSFELAAKKLFISQSAVSQRIKLLEENIGQPILVRKQPLALTPIGELLLSHYKKVEQLEVEIFSEIIPKSTSKPVKISLVANADSVATWFINALADVLKRYKIELNLLIEPEDRTLDKLKTGQAIGAVSIIKSPLKGFRSFELGIMRYCLVASPSFEKQYFSQGVNKHSLKMAPAVSYDHKDDMHVKFIAEHFKLSPDEYYCHSVGSSEAFVELAKQGIAYCLVPELQVTKELSSGELIKLCPDKVLIERLYWHSWILVKGINQEVSKEIIRVGQKLLK